MMQTSWRRNFKDGDSAVKPAPLRLPRTHRVKKRLAGGRVAFYWYRFRGGPLMMKFEGDDLAQALSAEVRGAESLARIYADPTPVVAMRGATVADLVRSYRSAPDGLKGLASSTKAQWVRWLDEIADVFGDLPTKLLSAKGITRDLIAWRNRREDSPRSADYGMQVLRRVLSWAVENGIAEANPALGIRSIYKANRADKIVTEPELKAIVASTSARAAVAIRLAAETGLRRGDLVAIKWDDVSSNSIEIATSKSQGRTRALVPLLPSARAVIDELRLEREALRLSGSVPSAFVLTTQHGRPWTKDALTQAFIRGAAKANVEDRTLHDLRGTAATRFILAGLSDEQTASILGWEPSRVQAVRRRYVDREKIALGIIAQMGRTTAIA